MARVSKDGDMFRVFALNLVFWLWFFVHTLVGIPLLTLGVAIPGPFRSHRANMRSFRIMITRYGRLVLASMLPWVRIRCEIPQESLPSPCIYICNHRSTSDPFLVAHLPGELLLVVNVWPFRIPIIGWFAKWAGYISVREMPFDLFLKTAKQRLEQGMNLVAFPEGTRAGEGPMGSFNSSLFRVALETGVPIVPVCISGNERIPLKGSLCLHPGTVRIKALPPVTAETYRDWNPFVFKTRIRNLIKNELEGVDVR